MNEYLPFALTVFTGFFAIMNPIANIPIFLGLVEDKTDVEKKSIAKTASITAFLIIVVFVLLGTYIFQLFSITIPAFKITGGILVFYVGFEMLTAKKTKESDADRKDDNTALAISPLAIPILSGPGTIVTAMNFASNADFIRIAIIIFVFAIMVALTYIAFNLSEKILEKLGKNLIAVIGKIMGLIIAIIGTVMVTEGIKLSFNI